MHPSQDSKAEFRVAGRITTSMKVENEKEGHSFGSMRKVAPLTQSHIAYLRRAQDAGSPVGRLPDPHPRGIDMKRVPERPVEGEKTNSLCHIDSEENCNLAFAENSI